MSNKPNLPTEIIAIIDRSGSMEMIREDAIGAFNSFFRNQKDEEGKANLSLVLFDDEYSPAFWHCPIGEVEPLDEKTFVPRGTTAMLDAIGQTMSSLKSKWVDETAPNVIVAILTDGYENASKEYSWDQVSKLIESARNEKGWEFVFLAAGQDAVFTAAKMSIPSQDADAFVRSPEGIEDAACMLSMRVSEKRMSFKK
jgi:Mg-chelatase subunit ChlD